MLLDYEQIVVLERLPLCPTPYYILMHVLLKLICSAVHIYQFKKFGRSTYSKVVRKHVALQMARPKRGQTGLLTRQNATEYKTKSVSLKSDCCQSWRRYQVTSSLAGKPGFAVSI